VNDLESIERAIAALEAQRSSLGDAVVDTALAPLHEKRDALVSRLTGEQRKLVTVLFADLVDFTVLSQTLDAEDTRTIVNAYFQRWHEHIEANGGVVEKFIGDAVMAVFGLHQSQEDDPHRAIRAALGMRSSLDRLNAELGAEHGVRLQMRVGIDTGDVVVSSLDDRPGQDFVVVGETVNRAARLQAAAPVGGVVISRDTHQHVRGSFSFEALEPLRLKGIPEPVPAYLVRAERPSGFRLDEARGVEGIETRTIGRDIHLQQLQNRFWDVEEEGGWRVVTIVGDAGVGKSRLLFEFDRWLAEITQGVWWFRGRAAPSAQNVPNGMLRDMVAARLDILDRDPASVVREKLEAGFGPVLGTGEASRHKAHLIGYWLGFDLSDSTYVANLRHDPQGLRERASSHLAEYFARLATQFPVAILLEDLHWADEGSLAWVDAADDELRSSRVLVVATARPSLIERHPHWGEGLGFHVRLALDPLSRRESRQLLDEILQRADEVPAALSDLLVSAAEGNPFHLEELVKWLIESGVIVTDGDTWHVIEDRIDRVKVPPTLKGVLQARIDALSPPEHLVLQRASVIGRVFWDDAVDSLQAEPAPEMPTDQALDLLRRREVVYQRPQSAFDETREFLFKHAVLRDVTYESVLRPRRQAYHELAARWLEQMTARSRRADEYAALIAGHYDNSGDRTSAARWYLRAGQQAASVHALAEATRLLDRAAEVVPDDEPRLRFDAVLAREVVYDRVGDRPAQEADLHELDRMRPQLDDRRRVQLLLRWASWWFHHSEYDRQDEPAQEAVELAREAGMADLEADALLWWGRGLTWKGDHDKAKEVLAQALVKAREADQARIVGETLRYQAIVANNQSEFPTAIALLEEAGAVHHDNNDLEGESTVLVQLGTVLFNQGRHREARKYLEESLPIFVASGHLYRQAVVKSNLGAILLQEGELGEARRLITEGIQLCLDLGDREGGAVALGILGDIYRRAGDHARAEENLLRSLAVAREIDFDFLMSDDLLYLGFEAADVGRADDAVSLMDESIEHARRASSPLAEVRARIGRGYVLLLTARVDEAETSLRSARIEAERLDLSALVVEVDVVLARAAQSRGDLEEAVGLIGSVVDRLDGDVLEGALRPGDLVLTTWQVLAAAGDRRAADALTGALDYVDDFAGRIDDPELREGFLHDVSAHAVLGRARAEETPPPD
jgi:class 3 adenylate cyclase/tetratricopeptide (TPR) repeat protein